MKDWRKKAALQYAQRPSEKDLETTSHAERERLILCMSIVCLLDGAFFGLLKGLKR